MTTLGRPRDATLLWFLVLAAAVYTIELSIAHSQAFATDPGDGASTVDGLRLVGLLQDRTHAVALIETPHGIDAVEQGGRVEGEQVARIAMNGVTLISGSTTRVLKWTEDGQ